MKLMFEEELIIKARGVHQPHVILEIGEAEIQPFQECFGLEMHRVEPQLMCSSNLPCGQEIATFQRLLRGDGETVDVLPVWSGQRHHKRGVKSATEEGADWDFCSRA